MAPEQIEHPLEVDHRADIYSLGVVFYQMLTGELPIGRFAPPSKKVQIDVRLDEVVLRALEKEPELRYQQASEVKTEVETIAHTKPKASPARGDSPLERAFPELGDWAKLFRRKWMPPVGTRHGNRVIIWPAVFFTFAAIAGAIFSILFLPYSIRFLLGGNPDANPGLTVVEELISVLLAAIVMTAVIRWKLTLPISKLPPLDSAAAREHAPASSNVSPPDDAQHADTTPPTTGGANGAPAFHAPDDAAVEEAQFQVQGPAIGLLVTGIVNWVVAVPIGLTVAFGWGANGAGDVVLVAPLSLAVLSIFVLVAALKMKRLQAYWLAVAAGLLAILISPASLIGLPIGIWALVVLRLQEVRAAFAANVLPYEKNRDGRSSLFARATSVLRWTARVLGTLLLIMFAAFAIGKGPPVVWCRRRGGLRSSAFFSRHWA